MMRIILLIVAALVAMFSGAQEINESTFARPDNITTSCYWYWISDHVSERGVVNDLLTMKEQGINRAFIGHQGIENMSRGDVKFGSERWWNILHTALKTASELGIEIGLFNGPGWSHMGGSWVKPEQSMRYLASQRVDLTATGNSVTVTEFLHPDNFLNNVRVLAFPRKHGKVMATRSDVDVRKTPVVTLHADAPMTLRSVKIYNTAPLLADVTVRLVNGEKKTDLKTFKIRRHNMTFHTGFDLHAPVAEAIADVRGQDFEIEFASVEGNPLLSSVELTDEPVISRYSEKTLARMHETPAPLWHDYKWPIEHNYTAQEVVTPSEIVDLTSLLTDDHTLQWEAPAGDWTIIRTYMAPTGIKCAPAYEDSGEGLEVDRWNRDALQAHYDAYMGEVTRRVPEQDRTTWKVVVCDSYETATQNFGDDFFEYFTARFGYDPTPFLLTYSGIVVGSTEQSDRFLWDLRRMIADRLAVDNIGAMDSLARRDGRHLWLETYGHWGFPGEFLSYGSHAGEVAGEFWSVGTLGDIENRAASSVAHIYGKRQVSSESFTYGGKEFMFSPRDMKVRGDRFFTEGINNSLLHLYVSQEYEDSVPGMIPWFGNEFNRKNTWYDHLGLFTDYLKRCNYLLQQGAYVADIAYFIGDDTPVMTGLEEPKCPAGYQFDFINSEVLTRDVIVNSHHELTLPYGNRYKLLVIPPVKRILPETLRVIRSLVEQGAVVLLTGDKPEGSPSLADADNADETVLTLANELWGYFPEDKMERWLGKGLVLRGYDIKGALRQRLLVGENDADEDFMADADSLLYCHVAEVEHDVYFVSNQAVTTREFVATFRGMAGKQPELWNPTTGTHRDLAGYKFAGGACSTRLRLEPGESTFVVFEKAAEARNGDNYPSPRLLTHVTDAWNVDFKSNYGDSASITMPELIDWTMLTDPMLKYFSGHATYTGAFRVKNLPKGERVMLNLGEVNNTCKVWINGRYTGGAWTAPYVVDITDAVNKGNNIVKVEVTNNFVNREIGDKIYSDNKKLTITRISHTATDPLQPSGLIGPVTVYSQK